MNVSSWCSRIIRWAFYLLVITVPLILTSINYELFEYNKMMVTYAITVFILGTWVVKMIADREIRVARTALDIPILLFVLSQFVSTVFSMDPHVSWMGYYSRFNGGMWSIISYAVLYYAFMSNFGSASGQSSAALESGIMIQESGKKNKTKQNIQQTSHGSSFINHYSIYTLLKVTLGTAIVVAAYGVAEHFGIDKNLWVQDVQNRVFSSLGQPNWLAAYLIALLPVSMIFALKHAPAIEHGSLKSNPMSLIKHVFWLGATVLFFVVLLFTRSRSGLVGFAAADLILWALIFIRESDKKRELPMFIFIHVLFAAIVFVNGSNISQLDKYISLSGIRNTISQKQTAKTEPKAPAGYVVPALESGGTESGTIRKYVWEAAVTAWKSTTKTFLIGTGTETFAFAFYEFRPVGHNMTSEWDFLYNKAHNEYLNYLATTGIFGLGSYLVFIGGCMAWFLIRVRTSGSPESMPAGSFDTARAVSFALFAGWVSILITNFFGFSVVIIQIFLFLFPAAIVILTTDKLNYSSAKLPGSQHVTAATIVTSAVSIILLGAIVTQWYADTLYASSYRLARSGQYSSADILMEKAITLNPNEPVYHDELSTTLSAIAAGALEQQQATVGAQLAQRAITENNRALATSPKNVNFWKTKTKIYYTLSTYDPKFNSEALAALTQARKLSPNDPKIDYNLAILYGREGANDKAVEFLKNSIRLKPNYRDSYYALSVFYTELNEPAEARNILTTYMTNYNPNDTQFADILSKMK